MAHQLVTRIDDRLAAELDALVADGTIASRSEAVRQSLEAWLDRIRRDRIGQAIVEGYRRVPQTSEELEWADAGAAEMIAEESW